jgi:hypothetical protein
MQFGEPIRTRIEFNLGKKKTVEEINEGVEQMDYLIGSQTATGDALRKAREEVGIFTCTNQFFPNSRNLN